MKVFALDIGAADLYTSLQEYIEENQVDEGATFSLTSVEVTAKTTYKLIDGVAMPQTIAFPEVNNLPMEHK